MRGAAKLGVGPDDDLALVIEAGVQMACTACGATTTYYGQRVSVERKDNDKRSSGPGEGRNRKAPEPGKGLGGIWDDAFTHRDRVLVGLGDLGLAICPSCAKAARDWKLGTENGLVPMKVARGRCPYLFADGEVKTTHAGLAGLGEVAKLSKRTKPFALLGGQWQDRAYHWAWAPVAWPPSRVFPALWVDGMGGRDIWLDGEAVAAVVAEAVAAGACDGEKGVEIPEDDRDGHRRMKRDDLVARFLQGLPSFRRMGQDEGNGFVHYMFSSTREPTAGAAISAVRPAYAGTTEPA